MKKKISQRSRWMQVLPVCIVVLCLGLAVFALQKVTAGGAGRNVTDEQIVQDLSTLEKAVWKHGKLLPQSLKDVSVDGLNGRLQDYQYHLVQQYEGGPGESFALCATFHSRSAKFDELNSRDGFYDSSSPEAYRYHQQGKQCFQIGWNINGGESSVGVMKTVPEWANH